MRRPCSQFRRVATLTPGTAAQPRAALTDVSQRIVHRAPLPEPTLILGACVVAIATLGAQPTPVRDGYVQLRGDSNHETARLQRLGLGTLREAAEQRLGAVIYSIAFTAHHGRWATLHSPPSSFVAPPEAAETLLHATGWPYLFIDCRRLPHDHWSRESQIGLKLYSPQPLDWSRHFDGLTFTDQMFPSRPDGHVPSWATKTLRRQGAQGQGTTFTRRRLAATRSGPSLQARGSLRRRASSR